MLLDAPLPHAPDLLSVLREATAPSHARLDDAFGALALNQRDGIARFLRAHAIGMAQLYPPVRDFMRRELGLICPDYPAMLRADLDALGEPELDAGDVSLKQDETGAAAGISYVVTGSRLGLTVIRQRGYWGEAEGFRSAYMEDGAERAGWKALVPWLRARGDDPSERDGARAAALESFDIFARAFAASAADDIARQDAHG
ncbi:biliverdin-producing heme oxygenase [Novosphingobium sp. Rr 2-17]|uniref:biliverdin-producing heme oxygenase n=1 Tax=Novosphingobium sp. Rr 2-17 TaxID=555793 RepID=UPI00063FC000|nr:biliverdin-producing heme oxygenase [Novosphingobium sp. Rr 2-17]